MTGRRTPSLGMPIAPCLATVECERFTETKREGGGGELLSNVIRVQFLL